MDHHLSHEPASESDSARVAVVQMRERLANVRRRLRREAAIRRDAGVVLRIESQRLIEGLSPRPLESLVSLADLTSHLTLSHDELHQVESASQIVEDIGRSLGTSDDASASGVRVKIERWARELGAADETALTVAEEITSEDSAAQRLRTLMTSPRDLDDSSWERAIDVIGVAFGDDVAVAVMRGRLGPADEDIQQPISGGGDDAAGRDVGESESSQSESEAAVLDRGESWLSSPVGTPTDAPSESTESHALATQPDDNVLLDENDDASESIGKRLAFGRMSLDSDRADDWLHDVASDVVEGGECGLLNSGADDAWSTSLVGDSEVDLTSGIVDAWHFLEREEPGLAHRLAVSDGSVSPQVVELWAISQRISFAHGSLAYAAAARLAEAKFSALRPAEMLLLRAALMRIALIAPETRAGVVIRSLPRSPEYSVIEQLCLRVASVGERLGGLNESPFRVADLTVARERLAAWANAVERQIAYGPDRPLYLRTHWSLLKLEQVATAGAIERWRQQRPVEQFLANVVEPLLSGENEVLRSRRQEIERVEQQLQPITELCDRGLLAHGEAAVRQYSHALALASGAAGYVPADVVSLREELEARRKSARETLADMMRTYNGAGMRISAAFFDEAVGGLIDLLDESIAHQPHEPEGAWLLDTDLWKLADDANAADFAPDRVTAEQITAYGRSPVRSLRATVDLLQRAGREEIVRTLNEDQGDRASEHATSQPANFVEKPPASFSDETASRDVGMSSVIESERLSTPDARQTDVMFDGKITPSVLDD